jgi:hypothetical protein
LQAADLDSQRSVEPREVSFSLDVYELLREILKERLGVDAELRRIENLDGKRFYVLWYQGEKGQVWILAKNCIYKVELGAIPRLFSQLEGRKILFSASTLTKGAFKVLRAHDVEIVITNWKFLGEAWPARDMKSRRNALIYSLTWYLRDYGGLPNVTHRDIEPVPLSVAEKGALYCKKNGEFYEDLPRLARIPGVTYDLSFLERQINTRCFATRKARKKMREALGVKYELSSKVDLEEKRSRPPGGDGYYSALWGSERFQWSESDDIDLASDPPW